MDLYIIYGGWISRDNMYILIYLNMHILNLCAYRICMLDKDLLMVRGCSSYIIVVIFFWVSLEPPMFVYSRFSMVFQVCLRKIT